MPKKSKKARLANTNINLTLITLTVTGTVLLIGRILLTETHHYAFLWWNLALAAVPLVFVKLAEITKNRLLLFFIIFTWLAFYPNAPYILTDYIHLGNVYSANHLLLDSVIITVFALDGVLLGFASLHGILALITKRFSNEAFYPLLVIISLLTGLGLYIGRYLRFNTWEIITNPIGIYETLNRYFLDLAKLPEIIVIVAVFSAFHGFSYILYSKLFNK